MRLIGDPPRSEYEAGRARQEHMARVTEAGLVQPGLMFVGAVAVTRDSTRQHIESKQRGGLWGGPVIFENETLNDP